MIKVLGGLIIIAASTIIGFEISRQFKNRPEQIRLMRNSLQMLDAEIMFAQAPLHEASRKVASQTIQPFTDFYKNFARKLLSQETTGRQAWEESLQELWSVTAFNQPEKLVLQQFGTTLGRHDQNSQQKQIMLAIAHLEQEELNAKALQLKYERMSQSLGFLTGILLTILLI